MYSLQNLQIFEGSFVCQALGSSPVLQPHSWVSFHCLSCFVWTHSHLCSPEAWPQFRMQFPLLSCPEKGVEEGCGCLPHLRSAALHSRERPSIRFISRSPCHSWLTGLQVFSSLLPITSKFPCLILKALSHLFLLDLFNFVLYSTVTNTSLRSVCFYQYISNVSCLFIPNSVHAPLLFPGWNALPLVHLNFLCP